MLSKVISGTLLFAAALLGEGVMEGFNILLWRFTGIRHSGKALVACAVVGLGGFGYWTLADAAPNWLLGAATLLILIALFGTPAFRARRRGATVRPLTHVTWTQSLTRPTRVVLGALGTGGLWLSAYDLTSATPDPATSVGVLVLSMFAAFLALRGRFPRWAVSDGQIAAPTRSSGNRA
jgi:hypothetical protein